MILADAKHALAANVGLNEQAIEPNGAHCYWQARWSGA